jgi:dipeptidase E
MEGRYFLAGGGNEKQSFQVDELFCKSVSKILYIPIAWNNVKINEDYKSHLEWLSTTFGKFGVNDITLLTNLDDDVNLNDYDGIYIGGGNTFKLLNFIKNSKFNLKLTNFVNQGGLIYGGSAGAIIFGSEIDISLLCVDRDENKLNLQDFTGLNILKNIDVQVHFQSDQIEIHKDYVRKTKRNIIAIPEESAIIVENDECLVVGLKPVYFITENNCISFENNSRFKIK